MAGNEIRIRTWVKDEVSGQLAKIKDKFDHVGKSSGFKALAQGVGMGAGISGWNALSGAISGATDFIGQSIDASRDLSETLSKSSVIFGDSADEIEAFGNTAATSMGVSKQAAIEAAATFGNFFVGLGEGEAEAAKMSMRLTSLAGDLASFNNMDPTEVLDKLRAGLAGEAEPLRRVGVFLSAAKVQAKAMEMGLGDAHGELDEGAKVLARYQIILDETGTAQGDFARTSESLANTQRTAAAELINAQAELGAAFEPLSLQVTQWQTDFLYGLDIVSRELGNFSRDVGDPLTFIGRMFESSEDKAKRMAEESARAIRIYMRDRVKDDLVAVADEADDTGRAFDDLADDAKRSATDTSGAWDTAIDLMVDSVDRLITDFFDPIETRSDIYQSRLEQNAAEERFRDAETAREKRLATDDILASIRDQADGLTDLGKQGKLTKADIDTFEKNVKASYDVLGKEVPADIRRIIAELRNLDKWDGHTVNVDVKVTGGGDAKKKASGGPVKANEVYLVGEQGQELFVPNEDGYIVPNHRLPKGGIGPLGMSASPTIVFQFNGMTYPPSPAQQQEMARTLGPALRDYLNRRG